MTVKELKEELSKYDNDMEVYDCSLLKIEKVYEKTWTHTNYPYDKPDKQILILE